jgi:polyphosphate kinase
MANTELINREISWLSFNHRVLQEAMDPSVPLVERMRFLGIFSNNLDEFFRVRVATVKRILTFDKKGKSSFVGSPQKILNQIHEIVLDQQKQFRKTYEDILKELEQEGIHVVNEKELNSQQHALVEEYYKEVVEPSIVPLILSSNRKFPYLRDKAIYLLVVLHEDDSDKPEYALIEIPTKQVSRFYQLPSDNGKEFLIYLDDVIRANLGRIFSIFDHDKAESYVFKITRDAELDLDDDISASFYDKIKAGLQQRKKGAPVRLVYDEQMPEQHVKYLIKKMKLKDDSNIIPGGRYHNFRDFMKFPDFGKDSLIYKRQPPLPHPILEKRGSLLNAINQEDILLHFPYQSFDYIIDILRESAIDPKVRKIQISLYRVDSNSRIINALVNAAKNGKTIEVIVELQARFDEEPNLKWSRTLQEAGINVHFGIEGLKVHSKILLITRRHERGLRSYAYIGTGNFHEGTARVYSDIALLTSNQQITREVGSVFDFIRKPYIKPVLKHLLVSPLNMRSCLIYYIEREIEMVEKGLEGAITLKVNNLIDDQVVNKIIEAAEYGVKIKLLVRGICSLGLSENGHENVEVRSIVDKYLEHTRIMIFQNGGSPDYYISSADWMTRNLDYRVEVGCPIYSESLREEIDRFIELQWNDNTKSRLVNKALKNKYVNEGKKSIRAQEAFYSYLMKKNNQTTE